MRRTREAKFLGWVALAVLIGGASFFIGSSLKPDEAPFFVFETAAPAHEVQPALAAVSPGGFTGFNDIDGGRARTVVAGRVVEVGPGSLTLEAAGGQRTLLRLRDQPRISRLESGSSELLRPGASVMVKLDSDDTGVATAVLVLSLP